MSAQGEGHNVKNVHVVVSLGTGRMPITPVEHSDIYRPEGLLDLFRIGKGVKNLGSMMVEAVREREN